jgi:alkaline phosphatase
MIEGASIDKQARLMDSERWILDTIEFDRAIERCLEFARRNPDTLVFPSYPTAEDGYPATTDVDFRMLVGYACNADRLEDWITNPLPTQHASHGVVTAAPHPKDPVNRDTAGNFLVTGQIADLIATHTASDIAVSAFGRGAHLFHGVMDNTDVFFKVAQAAAGDSHLGQMEDLLRELGWPGEWSRSGGGGNRDH